MTESSSFDIIAVGAHPDDVEIGCGGTLAALADQGLRVGIVDLTDGEPTPNCPSVKIRLAEANAAAGELGVERIVLALPNRKLFDTFETRVELAKQFRRHRPKVVLSIGGETPLASPDHWQAKLISDAAVFYCKLTKWDDQFDGLSPHTISRQVYYSFFFESDWTGRGPGQFVYDISKTIDRKLGAIRCYKTQFEHKPELTSRVRSLSAACGTAAGFEFGEVLTAPRTLGSRDLMATLFP